MVDIHIKETDCYGIITKNCTSYDDINYLGNSLILFELFKIKCFIKAGKGIIGIELTYKFIENQQEYKTIDVISDTQDFEQEFLFKKNEKIINVMLFRKDIIQGFEITTNFKRIYRFGLDDGEKIMLNEFSLGKNLIVGFKTKFHQYGMAAIGFYYIDKKLYSLFLYSGLFYLRAKLKNAKFKKNIEENLSKFSYEIKAILNVGLLPKNNFYEIMKYIVEK